MSLQSNTRFYERVIIYSYSVSLVISPDAKRVVISSKEATIPEEAISEEATSEEGFEVKVVAVVAFIFVAVTVAFMFVAVTVAFMFVMVTVAFILVAVTVTFLFPKACTG